MRGFERMTLANMRLHGVRSVIAACANCGRSTDVHVDQLPRLLLSPRSTNGSATAAAAATRSGPAPLGIRPRQSVPDYRRERPPMP